LPVKKIHKTVLSKNLRKKKNKKLAFNKKISIDDIPFATMRITLHALRWIFLLIFMYIIISIIILIIQGGNESVTNIVVYSITGFFTFFMGYFGWMFARSIVEFISGKEPKKDDF